MRKILVLSLCLLLILTSCSTKQQIPKDISEDFYNDMLEANKLIEKSIATRYDYLFEDYMDKIMLYSLLTKEELTEEDIKYINENKININQELTSKEKHIVEILLDISINIGMLCISFEDRHDISKNDFFESLFEKLNEQHKQFKVLLEIEEP